MQSTPCFFIAISYDSEPREISQREIYSQVSANAAYRFARIKALTGVLNPCFASLNVKFAKQTLSASSPKRRAFLLVGVGAFDDPLLSVVLHKAFSSGRRCGALARRMRCKKRKIKKRTPHPSDSFASLRVCHLLPLEKAWLRLSPCNLVSPLLIVGDDILGVPFV